MCACCGQPLGRFRRLGPLWRLSRWPLIGLRSLGWGAALAWSGGAWAQDVASCVDQGTAGDWSGALDCLYRLDEATATVWAERAVTRAWLGDLQGALAAYAEALAQEPENVGARVGRARVLGWLGYRQRVQHQLESVLHEHPENVEALETLARLHEAPLSVKRARHMWVKHEELTCNDAPEVRPPRGRFELGAGVGGGPDGVFATASALLEVAVSGATRNYANYTYGSTVIAQPELGTGLHQGELGVTWQPGINTWLGAAAGVRSDWWVLRHR